MSFKKVKVGDFLIRIKDTIPIIDSEEYKLVTIRLYHNGVQLRKVVKGSEMQAERMSRIKAGQFILSGIDARNGAFGIIPKELDGAVVTNDFWHFEIDKNLISDEYFLWLTSTPYFDDICNKASDGTTNRIRLQANRFYSQELMIPEIQDQHKVVEKLKSTNSKIKQLEEEYKFQLTQLSNLNQAILQEAVQGKLVTQDPNDEPASELLKRIKAEKAKSGKKEKPLPPIKPEAIPFEIPESWIWCRLGELCQQITDGEHLTPPRRKSGRMLLSAKNVRDGFFDFDNVDYISEEDFQKSIQRCKPEIDDVLIVSVGATIGRSAILKENKEFALVRSVALIKPFIQSMSSYFKFIFDSPLLQKEISGRSWGTAQPCLYLNQIKELTIPLPPLFEQKRIVSEIENQLAKTKQLKEHIIANQQATEQLLKALLHEAFEVEEMQEV